MVTARGQVKSPYSREALHSSTCNALWAALRPDAFRGLDGLRIASARSPSGLCGENFIPHGRQPGITPVFCQALIDGRQSVREVAIIDLRLGLSAKCINRLIAAFGCERLASGGQRFL